jgi:hypothetical protein
MAQRVCPKCASNSISDSRQRYFELPLNILCLKAYRCNRCELRFWRISDRQKGKMIPYLAYAGGAIALIGLIWMMIIVWRMR